MVTITDDTDHDCSSIREEKKSGETITTLTSEEIVSLVPWVDDVITVNLIFR